MSAAMNQARQSFRTRSYKNLNITLGLIVLLFIGLCSFSGRDKGHNSSRPLATDKGRNTPSHEKLALSVDQVALLDELQAKGILSIEPALNKAYVAPALWEGMNAKLKEDVAAAIAIYCSDAKGNTIYGAEMYDQQSGRKLAKWSRTYGFKVY